MMKLYLFLFALRLRSASFEVLFLFYLKVEKVTIEVYSTVESIAILARRKISIILSLLNNKRTKDNDN